MALTATRSSAVIWRYDQGVYPPVPVIDVSFARADEVPTSGPHRALLDTGAGATLVPSRHLDGLNLSLVLEAFLRGPWGDRRTVQLYRLDLLIGDLRFPAVEVVADDLGEDVVIGRNVLNKLVLLLDGPGELLELRPDRA